MTHSINFSVPIDVKTINTGNCSYSIHSLHFSITPTPSIYGSMISIKTTSGFFLMISSTAFIPSNTVPTISNSLFSSFSNSSASDTSPSTIKIFNFFSNFFNLLIMIMMSYTVIFPRSVLHLHIPSVFYPRSMQ